MNDPIEAIMDRASTRGHWHLEPSSTNDETYLVRSLIHGVVAENLNGTEAVRIVSRYNAARNDAAALAEQLREPLLG